MKSQRQRGRPALHDVVFDKIVKLKISESLRDEIKDRKVYKEAKRNVSIGWNDFIRMIFDKFW